MGGEGRIDPVCRSVSYLIAARDGRAGACHGKGSERADECSAKDRAAVRDLTESRLLMIGGLRFSDGETGREYDPLG